MIVSPRRYLLVGDQPLEVIIGLEVHARISSKYKIFSGTFNTIQPLDEGLPGSLPVLNVLCVNSLFLLADLVRAQTATSIDFTRKSYFCVDLAQGFQITQHFHPLLTGGVLELQFCLINNKIRLGQITISMACLEHDAGRFARDKSKISYMRSGGSLLEIVTSPCVDSVDCVKLFVAKLRLALISTKTSRCVMADSDLRFDLNFSIASPLSTLSFKTEIKNLNWLSALEELISCEVASFGVRKFTACTTKRADLRDSIAFTARLKEREYEYKQINEANLNTVKTWYNQSGAQVLDYGGFCVLALGTDSTYCRLSNFDASVTSISLFSIFGFKKLSFLLKLLRWCSREGSLMVE
ncbi:MAG: hypothetical protein ACKERG_00825 [Candidatus Hodgkinia cicadicola]